MAISRSGTRPYASEVVNSSVNAIVHDPNFDWTGEDFVDVVGAMIVIYEMHVGSFNDSDSAARVRLTNCASCAPA